MRHNRMKWSTLAAALAALSLVACKKKEAPAVSADTTAAPAAAPAPAPVLAVMSVDLGKSIDAEKKVTAPAETFAPRDTIYASVSTEGSASTATLTATWSFTGGATPKVVKTDSTTISPTGPTVTEFHVSSPKGWPVGKYKVDVALNGAPTMSKEFEVKK